ncbi:YraN family protein [Taylorella equigenitalis]|uniref:YraN family protein n=1 Tax=Taylorella equigenitalis TaxID=29575 RepID=UPI0006C41DEE|nr:YraN family protein [Taylorella equigenitalis]ASY30010.1 YraN family protein [Taylorella equigenitalis]ASY40304.1 YraN family protein [Taylorella equigenitalis]KOS59056.1 endonuclease [Taylorella equigenitalis]
MNNTQTITKLQLNSPTQRIGQIYETKARLHLESQGLELLNQNLRCKVGEIDLIMVDGHELVFIEVRYRKKADFGNGLESINFRKIKRFKMTAMHLLPIIKSKYPQVKNYQIRFDVVYFDGVAGTENIDWIKNILQ